MTKKIDVIIAGRSFPVKVKESEVAELRAIEKDLNQRINDFNLRYKEKDKLDCVIMTLLTIAVENKEKQQSEESKQSIKSQLEKLNSLLEVGLS